jgi:hypothetical protein
MRQSIAEAAEGTLFCQCWTCWIEEVLGIPNSQPCMPIRDEFDAKRHRIPRSRRQSAGAPPHCLLRSSLLGPVC